MSTSSSSSSSVSSLPQTPIASAFYRPTFSSLRGRRISSVSNNSFFPAADRSQDIDAWTRNLPVRLLGITGHLAIGGVQRCLSLIENAGRGLGASKKTIKDIANQLVAIELQEQKKTVEQAASVARGTTTIATGILGFIPIIGTVAQATGNIVSQGITTTEHVTKKNLQFIQYASETVTPATCGIIATIGRIIAAGASWAKTGLSYAQRYFQELEENPDKLASDILHTYDTIATTCNSPLTLLRLKNTFKGLLRPFPLPEQLSEGQLLLFLRRSDQEHQAVLDSIKINILTDSRVDPKTLKEWEGAVNNQAKDICDKRKLLKDMYAFYMSLNPIPEPIRQLPFATSEELFDEKTPVIQRREKLEKALILLKNNQVVKEEVSRILPFFSDDTTPEVRSRLYTRVETLLKTLEKYFLDTEYKALEAHGAEAKKLLLNTMLFRVSSSNYWKLSDTQIQAIQNALNQQDPLLPYQEEILKSLFVMDQMLPEIEKKLMYTPEVFQELSPHDKVKMFRLILSHSKTLSIEEKQTLSSYSHLKSFQDWKDLSEPEQQNLAHIICRNYNRLSSEKQSLFDRLNFHEITLLSKTAQISFIQSIKEIAINEDKPEIQKLCDQCLSCSSITKELIKKAKQALSIEQQKNLKSSLEVVQKYSKLDQSTLQGLRKEFNDRIAKFDQLTRTSNEEQELAVSKQMKELIDDILQVTSQGIPFTARQVSISHTLPSQSATGPSIRPDTIHQQIGPQVISTGRLHVTGTHIGSAAHKVFYWPGQLARLPFRAVDIKFKNVQVFDVAWNGFTCLLETNLGPRISTYFLGKMCQFSAAIPLLNRVVNAQTTKSAEAFLHSTVEIIVSIPQKMISYLAQFLDHVKALKKLQEQQHISTAAADATIRESESLMKRWDQFCPTGSNEALCTKAQKDLFEQTIKTMQDRRAALLSQTTFPAQGIATLLPGQSPAASGILHQAEAESKKLRDVLDQNKSWLRFHSSSDAAKAQEKALGVIDQEILSAKAEEQLHEFQKASPFLHTAAHAASYISSMIAALTGINLLTDIHIQTASLGIKALELVLTTSQTAFHGTTWLNEKKRQAEQKVLSLTDKALTEADTYLSDSTSSFLSIAMRVSKFVLPAFSIATGGSTYLTDTLLKMTVPHLIRRIGPENVRALISGTGQAVAWSFNKVGEFSNSFITTIFDSCQERYNAWQGHIDPQRLDHLAQFSSQERQYLLELIASSKNVKEKAPQLLEKILLKENQENFFNPGGVWSIEDQKSFAQALLQCYNLVTKEEQKNITPTLFLSLPEHIQNRIREIVKAEGRETRTNLIEICFRYNALSINDKKKVHSLSVNEFWLLDEEIQNNLLSLLATSSQAHHIPGTTAYEKYTYCKQCSRKELKPFLAFYAKLNETDFSKLTPSQALTLNQGKLEHLIDLLKTCDHDTVHGALISELRASHGNISWCKDFETLKQHLKNQSEELQKAENSTPPRLPNIPIQELKLRRQIIEHLALQYSSLGTRLVTIRDQFLNLTEREWQCMSATQQQSLLTALKLQLASTSQDAHTIEKIAAKTPPLSPKDLQTVIRIFNQMPELTSACRMKLENENDMLKQQEELLVGDIRAIDTLYTAALQDRQKILLSAGHFLHLARENQLKQKNPNVSVSEKASLDKEIKKHLAAKDKRIQELEAHEQLLKEFRTKRQRKEILLQLQGKSIPKLPELSPQKISEIHSIFTQATKNAICQTTTHVWIEGLQQNTTLTGKISYILDKLTEEQKKIEEIAKRKQSLSTVPPDIDNEMDKKIFRAYQDIVLSQAEDEAQATFEQTLKEFLEKCPRHVPSPVAKIISSTKEPLQLIRYLENILQEPPLDTTKLQHEIQEILNKASYHTIFDIQNVARQAIIQEQNKVSSKLEELNKTQEPLSALQQQIKDAQKIHVQERKIELQQTMKKIEDSCHSKAQQIKPSWIVRIFTWFGHLFTGSSIRKKLTTQFFSIRRRPLRPMDIATSLTLPTDTTTPPQAA